MRDALWQSVLGEIELSVSTANFQTWFKDTEILDSSDDEVVIAVKNIFAKKQFEARFNDQITEILKKNGIAPRKITYEIKTVGKKTRVNRETTRQATTSAADELIASPRDAPSSITQSTTQSEGGLNPRYTLDNFIVGSSNDLAYAASHAVAANPGMKYNPIYFYGGVGLGKTHLMQAIGNEIKKNQPDVRILYVTTETFVNEFLDYIRFKKKGFSTKYRNVDVLIIDDMQFIAGKEKTQEEFFHTFNHLHQHNKQIIISSDKPPRSIPTLTERLRSRFEMGMAIDVQMPDFETRCAIITAKAGQSGVQLDSEVVEYLANTVKTNIRELEGALNQVLAYAEMRGTQPDLALAEGIIGSVKQSRPQHISARQVIDKTAKYFQIKVDEICSPRRDKHIVVPRQIAMYLLRSELKLSFPAIANELGRKDHTTAMHSVDKIERAMKLDQATREQINTIREHLYGA